MKLKSLLLNFLVLVVLTITSVSAFALMPPHPDLIKQWQDKGILEQKMKELADASDRLLSVSRL